jgi:hypothetical protein
LAALLDRVVSNGMRTVVVERAGRLARDLMVQKVNDGQPIFFEFTEVPGLAKTIRVAGPS